MTGDLTSCEQALQRAETQFDRVSADDVAAEYYTVNEFSRLSGSCYLFLDLPERAEPILRATARSLTSSSDSIRHSRTSVATAGSGVTGSTSGNAHPPQSSSSLKSRVSGRLGFESESRRRTTSTCRGTLWNLAWY
jgi:hypothetical protein